MFGKNKLIEMNELIFHYPNKVIFGNGVINRLASDCLGKGVEKIFILGISPLKAKMDQLTNKLLGFNIQTKIDYSIQDEPVFQDIDDLLAKVRTFDPDLVVGIGGGSVLDTAKLLAVLHKGSQTWEEIIGVGLVKKRNTKMVCIPTTSGTGSEVSPNAIFLDKRDGGKKGVISPYLVPDAAYIDPELTVGIPAAITASTGVDALTHCMEAYMNKFAHPITDMYALEGIRLIAKSLPKACANGSDIEARNNVALGSLYGGMCLGPVNTAAVHALAYPLGSMFGIAHGLSNAVLLPAVMRFNIPEVSHVYAQVAAALGVPSEGSDVDRAYKGVEALEHLMDACGIKRDLKVLGIRQEDVPELAREGMKDRKSVV